MSIPSEISILSYSNIFIIREVNDLVKSLNKIYYFFSSNDLMTIVIEGILIILSVGISLSNNTTFS